MERSRAKPDPPEEADIPDCDMPDTDKASAAAKVENRLVGDDGPVSGTL